MIYVDLDNTLIDSVKRLLGEMSAASKYGLNEQNFHKAVLTAFKNGGVSNFGHKALFKACREILPSLSEKLLDDWREIVNAPHIFPDAMQFLNSFPSSNLTLLTTGNREFQLSDTMAGLLGGAPFTICFALSSIVFARLADYVKGK